MAKAWIGAAKEMGKEAADSNSDEQEGRTICKNVYWTTKLVFNTGFQYNNLSLIERFIYT